MDCAFWSTLVRTADNYMTLPDLVPFGLPIRDIPVLFSLYIDVRCLDMRYPEWTHFIFRLMKPRIT